MKMANSKRTLRLHKESVSCPQFWMTHLLGIRPLRKWKHAINFTLYSGCFHKTAMPTRRNLWNSFSERSWHGGTQALRRQTQRSTGQPGSYSKHMSERTKGGEKKEKKKKTRKRNKMTVVSHCKVKFTWDFQKTCFAYSIQVRVNRFSDIIVYVCLGKRKKNAFQEHFSPVCSLTFCLSAV